MEEFEGGSQVVLLEDIKTIRGNLFPAGTRCTVKGHWSAGNEREGMKVVKVILKTPCDRELYVQPEKLKKVLSKVELARKKIEGGAV